MAQSLKERALQTAIGRGLDVSQPYTTTKSYGPAGTPYPTSGGGGGISAEYAAAKSANEMRYAQAMSIYDEIIRRYQPGGTFGQAALGQLEKQKVRDVGAETQQMISSGLYGTTTTAGLPGKWEAEVGAPSRLRLEDIMMERLSQAQIGKAGFIERRQDVYPDVGAYAGYTQQAAQAAPAAPQRSLAEFMKEFKGEGLAAAKPVEPAGERAYARPITPTAAPTDGQAAQPTSEQAAGIPTSLAVGTQMKSMLGQPAAQGYSPGDSYVGGSMKDGVTTSYYRTKTGKIVPGPTYKG